MTASTFSNGTGRPPPAIPVSPYNQVPSLHIALAVILWVVYAGKTRGMARILLTLWFVIIGASVLTTYQHHFIDLPTGFALGWLCVWLWPMQAEAGGPIPAWRTPVDPVRHLRKVRGGIVLHDRHARVLP